MCAMALVHLRVWRVIYIYKNSFDQGHLNSERNLMSYKINHHYDVFHYKKDEFIQIYN